MVKLAYTGGKMSHVKRNILFFSVAGNVSKLQRNYNYDLKKDKLTDEYSTTEHEAVISALSPVRLQVRF